MADNEEDAIQTEDAIQQALVEQAVQSDKPIVWDAPSKLKKIDAGAGIKRKRQMAFLKAFEKYGNITQSLKAIGISATTYYKWQNTGEPWWRDRFKEAVQAFRDSIQAHVHDWAMNGMKVPIIGKVPVEVTPGFFMLEDQQLTGADGLPLFKTVRSENITMFDAKRYVREFRDKYEPEKDDGVSQVESAQPMARILIRLEMISANKQQFVQALPENIIDIVPESTPKSEV